MKIRCMRIYFLTAVFATFILTVTCCSGREGVKADLGTALRLSNENRPELEKVLEYYSKDKKDTLKLKAAKFLISNMIAHYSIGGEAMDRYVRGIDSVLKDKPATIRTIYYRIAARQVVAAGLEEIEFDLHHIKADYLIRNIERSFQIWADYRQHYPMSFGEFCEYILPYRVEYEPLSDWKDSTMSDYYGLSAIDRVGFESGLYDNYITYKTSLNLTIVPAVIPDTLFRRHNLDCIDIAFDELYLKRSVGIPVVVDFVPHYPTKENRHYWTSIIDRRYISDNLTTYKSPYAAKVYRKTYSLNPIPVDKVNFVPSFLRSPYNKDVTELYQQVASLEYDFGKVPGDCEYGYLAVFNNLSWQELGWARMQHGKVKFDKIGCDIMYLPTYYEGSKQVCGRYPVWLDTDGKAIEMKPDKASVQNVTLDRKFTYNLMGDYWGWSVIGTMVLATNNLKNSTFDTIATFDSYKFMTYDSVLTHTDKKYKYWMLQKKPNAYPELGSVLLLNERGESLQGSGFTMNENKIVNKTSLIPTLIFSDDVVTGACILHIIGVEFDEPRAVSEIKYVSRNDGNGVYPGEEYELFYFDEGGWVSLGRKMATGYDITYENVPTHALFWLRNRTKGVEERPFTVDRGRVRFW